MLGQGHGFGCRLEELQFRNLHVRFVDTMLSNLWHANIHAIRYTSVALAGDRPHRIFATHRHSAMIRKMTQKIIRCSHQKRLQCLFVLPPNPGFWYDCVRSICSAVKFFSESWETMMATVAGNGAGGKGNGGRYMRRRRYTQERSEEEWTWKASETTVWSRDGINEGIWGRSERRLMKQHPRSAKSGWE